MCSMVVSGLARRSLPCMLRRSYAAPAEASSAVERERTQSISVHKGLKIQAALCVERPPLVVVEPDQAKRWRAFQEAWSMRTNNHLTLEDEIVFMRFHFHFFQDRKATQALAAGAQPQVLSGSSGGGGGGGGGGRKGRAGPSAISAGGTSDGLVAAMNPKGVSRGGLDSLIGEEGLNLAFPELGRKTTQRRRVEKKKEEQVDHADLRSLRRLTNSSLFLLVRYKGAKHWTFPKADRAHGQPMRETLLRLSERQFGAQFNPYVVGACPFAYRKRKSQLHPGIEGRKIFYYRARLVPGSELILPGDSPVTDWAWCSREELSKFLDGGEWYVVRDSLPLDDLSASISME
eukprot:TRINITY_DN2529_c0_g1_i1.p1 TRINITY_DN2529_c0_g1~~TRINITY_DN2529_c0_g1_i1.p1  ORF type:complete len:363 (+),score=64.77 TRINITY_DN2529_c0_g1_i1:54-1091(+)